jgi:hypothetical protein
MLRFESPRIQSLGIKPQGILSVGIKPLGIQSLGNQMLEFQSLGIQSLGIISQINIDIVVHSKVPTLLDIMRQAKKLTKAKPSSLFQ